MAIVSKGGGGEKGGGGPTAAGSDPRPIMTNLPPKTGPIAGRKPEMQLIAESFATAARSGRAGRTEIVGKCGVGATSVGLELARRGGGRYPGGAWYVHLGMGDDVAWADVAAFRGAGPTSDLKGLAAQLQAHFMEGPKALVVIDGITNADQLAFLGGDVTSGPDVFLVSEEVTGAFEDVVHVSEVPDQGPRRIAHAVFHMRDGSDSEPPAVRSTDGLAVTATLAARAAVAYEGKAGPISIPDHRAAMMSLVPMLQQHPVALEILMLCGVAHPVRIPVDALFMAISQLREGRGEKPEVDQVGQGVLWLARLGIVMPDDEHRVSMHPLIQEVVREMASTPADLKIARESLALGLIEEAKDAIADDGGLDVLRASLHQLRFVTAHLEGEVAGLAEAALAQAEQAAGLRD